MHRRLTSAYLPFVTKTPLQYSTYSGPTKPTRRQRQMCRWHCRRSKQEPTRSRRGGCGQREGILRRRFTRCCWRNRGCMRREIRSGRRWSRVRWIQYSADRRDEGTEHRSVGRGRGRLWVPECRWVLLYVSFDGWISVSVCQSVQELCRMDVPPYLTVCSCPIRSNHNATESALYEYKQQPSAEKNSRATLRLSSHQFSTHLRSQPTLRPRTSTNHSLTPSIYPLLQYPAAQSDTCTYSPSPAVHQVPACLNAIRPAHETWHPTVGRVVR